LERTAVEPVLLCRQSRRAGVKALRKGAAQKRGELVMNLPSKILAAAVLAATPTLFTGPAAAAPIGASSALHDTANPGVETVAWRGGFGGHGWGGHGWGGRGWGGAAAGLAAGAIIGGAVAASQPWYGYDYSPGYYGYGYDPGYYSYGYSAPGGYVAAAPGEDAAYCAQRFRSYDPASGTYLGFDGYRHPCP
jgi:hypothetical protein